MKKWFVRLKNLESGDEVLVSGTGKTPKDLVDLEIQTKGKEAKIFVEATLRSNPKAIASSSVNEPK